MPSAFEDVFGVFFRGILVNNKFLLSRRSFVILIEV